VSYRLSGRAESDLAEIWDYSAGQWSVDQADRYMDALVSRFAWLRTCADVPDLIEIVRVLHGRMEPDKHII